MATAQLPGSLRFQSFTSNGALNVGGFLYSYLAGTTSPTPTYVDSTQTTTNTNPVVLDSYGSCPLWLNSAVTYKFVVTDPYGNILETIDQVGVGLTSAGLSAALANYVTNTSLASTLGSYVTSAALTATLGGYVTTGSLAGYAPLASPAFTGVPTAPTAAPGTNTTQLATTAFVNTAVSGGSVSLNANGYSISAQGLYTQWGVTPGVGGSPIIVAFPITFPNAVFSVIPSSVGSNQTLNWDQTNTTTSSLHINTGATAIKVSWVAFGY